MVKQNQKKKTASIKLPIMDIKDSVILDKAHESVVPTNAVCRDYEAYWQDEQGAAIYNTKKYGNAYLMEKFTDFLPQVTKRLTGRNNIWQK